MRLLFIGAPAKYIASEAEWVNNEVSFGNCQHWYMLSLQHLGQDSAMKLLVEWGNESIVLEPEKVYVLGRDISSDISIDSSRISRAHLRFSFNKKSWEIQDLASSNGTFVGSKKIEKIEIVKQTVLDLVSIQESSICGLQINYFIASG